MAQHMTKETWPLRPPEIYSNLWRKLRKPSKS